MPINSRTKGKVGEREWCKFLARFGFKARRSQQFCGYAEGDADVLCEDLTNLHMEVKRVEALNIGKSMEQSIRDAKSAGKGQVPIVAHRKNNKPWLVTLPAEDFLKMQGGIDAELSTNSAGA